MGQRHRRGNLLRDCQLQCSERYAIFPFARYSFPWTFPQICKKCWQKKKHSNIYLVFNNIKNYLTVFVILILRL